MANTLAEYYQSQGQALPSVQQRQSVAQQAGIQGYSGTASQNAQLLSFLQGGSSSQSTVTPNQLAPTQPLNLPSNQPVPQNTELPNYADMFKEVPQGEVQNQSDSLSLRLAELAQGLTGQTEALKSAEDELGVSQKKKELAELSGQIGTKQAEYKQLIEGVAGQGRGITSNIVSSKQRMIANQAGSEIGVLNARALALQGNIEAAQEEAQRAIELKYAPIKEEIEVRRLQLEAIAPMLNREQKERARQQELRDNLALKEIEKKQEEESQIQNIMLQASQFAPQSVLNQIRNAKTIEDAILLGGKYLNDPQDDMIKKLQIQKLKQELDTNSNAVDNKLSAISLAYADKPTELLSNVFKSSGAKTNKELSDATAVISAAEGMANKNADKQFKGVGGFLVRLTRTPEAIANKNAIAGLELKVQQWASGASLTKEQERMVKKMTPDKNDTDKKVANKLNALTNYMMSDISGRLATQGINFSPNTVDYWGNKDVKPLSAQIGTALGSGYKPQEIVAQIVIDKPELSAQIDQARKSGYSYEEILQFLIDNN